MKAEVTISLAVRTRKGHLTTTEVITGPKESIVSMVDNFIQQRVSNENYIRATKFDVVLKDSRNRAVDLWSYCPTYR